MTRAQQTISLGLFLATTYVAAFLHVIPLESKIQDDIVPVLPFWALVSFGAYLLFKLGYGVLTFNDVPEKYKELMSEIELAKKDLKMRGVDVD